MRRKSFARRWIALAPAVALLASLGVAAPPAAADVLVMLDGSQVETRGAWKIDGRQVVFTLPGGTLSAVRLSEVDLDASYVATERAKNPPVEEAAEEPADREREPVMVLTNEDVGVLPIDTDGAGIVIGDGADGATEGADATSTGRVAVADWSYGVASGDALYELTGRLENRTGQTVENLELYVDIIAVDGGVAQPDKHFLRQARVAASRLEPDESVEFSYGVTVRDLTVFTDAVQLFEAPRVNFDVQYRTPTVRPVPGAAADADDGERPEIDDAPR